MKSPTRRTKRRRKKIKRLRNKSQCRWTLPQKAQITYLVFKRNRRRNKSHAQLASLRINIKLSNNSFKSYNRNLYQLVWTFQPIRKTFLIPKYRLKRNLRSSRIKRAWWMTMKSPIKQCHLEAIIQTIIEITQFSLKLSQDQVQLMALPNLNRIVLLVLDSNQNSNPQLI